MGEGDKEMIVVAGCVVWLGLFVWIMSPAFQPAPQPSNECHARPGTCDIDTDWRPPSATNP